MARGIGEMCAFAVPFWPFFCQGGGSSSATAVLMLVRGRIPSTETADREVSAYGFFFLSSSWLTGGVNLWVDGCRGWVKGIIC